MLQILFLAALTACEAPEPPAPPAETAAVASSPPPPLPVTQEAPVPPEPVLTPKMDFSTVFAWKYDAENRGINIERIAHHISGTVLKPGETWSFNTSVGPRTLSRGFFNAPSLLMGEVVESVGGGSCQVSSTLYAAALLSGMEIVSRRAHSRPSKYIHMGMDAAVSFPKACWDAKKPDARICLDLVIKNPFAYPVHIQAKIHLKDNIRKVLSFTLFGESPERKQDLLYRWVTYKVHDFPTRYRRVTRWEDDRKKLKQSGSTGHEGALRLKRDGKEEWIHSHYLPVPEVWLVGRDFEIPEEMNGAEDGDDDGGVDEEGGQGGASGGPLAQ